MAGEEPEVGDQVSWQHGSSHPSGEVAEKKTEGDLAIQSKRGNTIKKHAEPGDPAIHMARPGNDVVKNQSELQVDEKASENKPADDNDEKDDDAPPSAKKRKADTEADGDEDEGVKKPKGARGRPKGSGSNAATPKKKAATPKKTATTSTRKATPKKAAAAAGGGDEKKGRGRPKGGSGSGGGGAKAKKDKKPTAPPSGVGKRTRSQKK